MNLIDNTGKLNNHSEYLDVLKYLELKTKYIEVVLIDKKKTNHLVDKFSEDIVSINNVSEWWGTKTTVKNKLIKIKASPELFEYLRKFETFCKYYMSYRGDRTETTDFGIDDIAFYNKRDEILLCTTTHEGYIMIKDDLYTDYRYQYK